MPAKAVFLLAMGTALNSPSSVSAAIPQPTTRTLQLSQPRRDLAAASTSNAAVFGGGCVPGSGSTYVCNDPSDVVDVYKKKSAPTKSGGASSKADGSQFEGTTLSLSEKRGWPTACAAGDTIVFLGGGSGGQLPHSKALDLVDVDALTVSTNASVMDHGRWGNACAEIDGDIYFGGGKIIDEVTKRPSMTDEVLRLKGDASGKPMLDGMSLVSHLSLAREAIGAVTMPGVGVMFAGGSGPWPPISVSVVDAFTTPIDGTEKHTTWKIEKIPDPASKNEYWIGVAHDGTAAYIADNHTVYTVGSAAVFSGDSPPKESAIPLQSGTAGSGIPAARMGQNGVAVDGVGVCFYSADPSSLYCYSPDDGSSLWIPLTAGHIAGAITSVGKTVLVGGGAAMDGTVTDVIDVVEWA